MIKVWYMNDDLFCNSAGGMAMTAGAVKPAMVLKQYTAVAEIDTDDLELAWKNMQNGVVTSSWLLDPPPGIRPLVGPHIDEGREYGWRSACTGDVFERNGQLHMAAMIGFDEVPAWTI